MNASIESWPGRSWYEAEAPPVQFPSVCGRHECGVAVIGAGQAGLSTALGLIERGHRDVAVIEAAGPGFGASGRNGGFVFAGYSLGNDALIGQLGRQRARLLHGWTRDSRDLIRERIERYRIDCQTVDEGVVLADWFGDDRSLFDFRSRMARELDFELEPIDREAMAGRIRSQRYGAGLHEPDSFHFHPLRHQQGLASAIVRGGGRVLANSPVRSIGQRSGRWRLDCGDGEVIADEVVLATGGYDRRLCPAVQRAVQPVATYIAVTEPLGERLQELLPRPVAVYDTRFAFDYYRPLADGRLLWGGRISMAARAPQSIRRLLARDMRRVFPPLAGTRFDFAWGGWMSYARHQMPLLGRLDNGMWYALAFGGHGMATTALAGEIVAEALVGKTERFDAFKCWQPDWAGGLAGRAWVQMVYWILQLRDRVREVG